MAYLSAQGVIQEFNRVRVLDKVDIGVELGRFHILAGENGAGKSTLVKILTGVQNAMAGEIRIDGRDPAHHRSLFDKIAYVPQELSLFQNLTVAENLFIPFDKSGHGGAILRGATIRRDAQALIDEFHIHAEPDDLVSEVSVSDQQLIQIARGASRHDFKVLILDEPTSSLTAFETERLFRVLRRLASEGRGIVFISHKMDEIFELGDEVTVLRNGLKVGHASMSDITERQLIALMAGDDVRTDEAFQPRAEAADVVMSVRNLCGPKFRDISFDLRRGEILGFAGLVGAGRSELMQCIFGFRKPSGGEVRLDGVGLKPGDTILSTRLGMTYLSEERSHHGIFAAMSVHDNIAVTLFKQTAPFGLVSAKQENGLVDRIFRQYDIRSSSRDKHIRFLSGGNQQKAIIGRAIARRPKVIIFDEPTKGIDVRTKMQIYGIMRELAEEGNGIILVSSEIGELMKCANRIITMWQGKQTGSFRTLDTEKPALISALLGLGEETHVEA